MRPAERGGPAGPDRPPLVSVIVPSYNSAKTLRACLESAFAQSHPAIEVVVADDASTDRSAQIGRELGCTLVTQPANKGVSAARNGGVAASHGEILFFLDSDVALAPDAVANAVRLLREDPGCGCVYGVYAKEPLVDDGPVEICRTLHLHSVLTRAVGLTATAVFALAAVPRRVFDEVGPFDENLRSAEDDDYSERLLGRYRIRLDASVAGRHDEADRLLPLLAEQFRRSQLLRFAAQNRLRRGALKVFRATGLAAVALTLATLPLAVVWPPLLAVPAVFLAASAFADLPLARLVLTEKGAGFFVFFSGVQFLLGTALIAGAAVGFLRTTIDSSFGPARYPGATTARPRPADLQKGC
ncbi:MAG TPA: glycosyltransferase family 2 protein [Streptosporangiaceae bacterium]|nr:glycosyltransferase family 2 protein [Streptosporangiaceae bacterium]